MRRNDRSIAAAALAAAVLVPAAAAAIGAVDVGARGGAGAVLGTGGGSLSLVVVLGILLFSGIAFLGKLFDLIAALLRRDFQKMAESAGNAVMIVVAVSVFFALWYGAAEGIAVATGWSDGAVGIGFVAAVVGYFVVFVKVARLFDRPRKSTGRAR